MGGGEKVGRQGGRHGVRCTWHNVTSPGSWVGTGHKGGVAEGSQGYTQAHTGQGESLGTAIQCQIKGGEYQVYMWWGKNRCPWGRIRVRQGSRKEWQAGTGRQGMGRRNNR